MATYIHRMRRAQLHLLILALFLVGAGCPRQETPAVGPDDANADLQHARQLWPRIEGYRNWTQPAGFEGWQDGTEPHGIVLRYYINQVAEQDLTRDGAIIVKANYPERSEDALMYLTIMEKRAGYDPETEDWFYVRYTPEGEVMEGPGGMPQAGLVGKGQAQGCIPCHAAAPGGDYLFMTE